MGGLPAAAGGGGAAREEGATPPPPRTASEKLGAFEVEGCTEEGPMAPGPDKKVPFVPEASSCLRGACWCPCTVGVEDGRFTGLRTLPDTFVPRGPP